MRLLACGGRNWTDEMRVRRILGAVLRRGDVLIHGAARGADRIAGRVAEEFGATVEAYRPDWKLYGRGAGPRRNELMLKDGRPQAVIAFHNDLSTSRGTCDMVERAREADLPVLLVAGDSIEVWHRPANGDGKVVLVYIQDRISPRRDGVSRAADEPL